MTEPVPLDTADEAAGRRAFDCVIAARAYRTPWFRSPGFADWWTEVRHVDRDEDKEIWVVDDGQRALGVAKSYFPLRDNLSTTWFDLFVDPDRRGRGVGSALLDRLVESARAHHRSRMVTEFRVPDTDPSHPYRRFAERHGFRFNSTEVVRHLDLPIAGDLLERLDAATVDHWRDDYRLETHIGAVPDPLLPSLTRLMGRLAVDAPTGDLEYEAEVISPERMRDQFDLEARQGRTRITTVALDADGEVVAYTELMLTADSDQLWQWGTLVDPEHRGRRLGMAVKLANLRRLQADFPERRVIITGNDDTNEFMVSVNRDLGFEIREYAPSYVREV